jgi:Zn-dependent M28 family amino/carboxypeptidase
MVIFGAGASYDSSPDLRYPRASATGATDNGAGTVVAMEVMRILNALHVKPRRTIRVGLWTGEEEASSAPMAMSSSTLARFLAPRSPTNYRSRSTIATLPDPSSSSPNIRKFLPNSIWTMAAAGFAVFISREMRQSHPSSLSGLSR